MVEIVFLPDRQTIRVPAGTTLLAAARLAGLVVEAPCNGAGTCGKCRVRLTPEGLAQVVEQGRHRLSAEETQQGFVLACQTEVRGDIAVALAAGNADRGLKILRHGECLANERDPFITKRFRAGEERTAVYGGGDRLGFEKGNTEGESYGVVVDIGTTTLVAELIDLHTGEERASLSALNPQARHAQDVLSRIQLASSPEGLALLYSGIAGEIDRLIGELAVAAGIGRDRIYEVVYSGNGCMVHLAANVNPAPLGKYPYRPVIRGGSSLKAGDHGLTIAPFGRLYLPPLISAYVGADITSGILATQLFARKGATLFVDIGTNGEMALAVDGRLTAASTAAGPAFEGMNIACGMRAGAGAIERFSIGPEGGVQIKTIGGHEAIGLCGSGLLDAVAELVTHGVIDAKGRFRPQDAPSLPPLLRERLQRRDGKIAFALTERVFLTQKDVRQVQLAKGAIRAGIEYLLASQGIRAGAIDRVLIAGSFGYHVRAESLLAIGLLPRAFAGKIELVGNTSQSGGRAFLLNRAYRQEMVERVQEVAVVELSSHQDFERVFVRCLGFAEEEP
ncbi:MAG: ASKHA domain-containing protein [Deltaproteobacteria bacterium]|nr:ASKHA domain-containing protein [Deltaproteobacteria bacterium]